MSPPASRARRAPPLLVLATILAAEILVARALHADRDELERRWHGEDVQERLDALHVLTSRGRPDALRFDQRFVERLLAEEDPRLREAAFGSDLAKFGEPRVQARQLVQPIRGREGEWLRSYLFHHRKVGGRRVGGGIRLDRAELGWYLDSLAQRPLDLDVVARHLSARHE